MAKKTLSEMELSLGESKAREQLNALFDEDSFTETDKFIDPEGACASVVTGYGLVDGSAVCAFAQDISVKSGAMNAAAAAKIEKLYGMALKNGTPVVGIYDSKGADIAEGAKALNAYSRIAKASAKLSGAVPQIAFIAGLCAGTAAMTAAMADITIMTEKSEFFMTPPFNSPDGGLKGAGKAQNAAAAGIAAITVKDDKSATETIKKLIRILPANNLELSGNDYYAENDAEVSADLKGEAMVKALADKDSVIELCKDFGKCAYTALGSLSWRTVGFVATDKAEGKLGADDCSKIARFVSFCDAFSIPVVTVLDSEGIGTDQKGELSGAVRDAAKLAQVYSSATTVKITLMTEKAYGAAYCATAPASDFVLAYEDSVIAAVPPKTAVIFLEGTEDADRIREYTDSEASAFKLCALGSVDRVIDPADTRAALLSALDLFGSKRVSSPHRKHINFVY